MSAQAPKEKPILVLDPGGHTQEVQKLLFTPDNKRLISVAEDKTIRIWDVDSGEQLRVLRLPNGPGRFNSLTVAALSPDGKFLAVGGWRYFEGDQKNVPIYLIDLEKGTMLRVLPGHTDTIVSLAFSKDGERLASGASILDPHPRVWNLDKDQSQLLLRWPNNYGKHVAFSPDGFSLAVVSDLGRGGIFDLARARVTASFIAKPMVNDIAWSPDGKTLVTAGGSLQLWNPDGTLRSTKEFKDILALKKLKASSLYSLAFHNDSRTLLLTYGTGGGSGAILYDLATDKEVMNFKSGGSHGALSPDGALVALAGNTLSGLTNYISLCKTDDGSVVHKLGSKNWISHGNYYMGWSFDSKSVAWPKASSFHLGDLQFAPGVKAEAVHTSIKEQPGLALKYVSVYQINVVKEGSPDIALKFPAGHSVGAWTLLGKDRVLVSDSRGNLHLFHAGTGARLRFWGAHNGPIGQLAPSPDGRYFLSYSNGDTLIHIWSPQQDQPLLSLFAMGPATYSSKATGEWVAWTPEGFYAASPGGEKLISWHIDNGPNALAKIVPGNTYRKSLYRPDIIQRLLEFGSVEKALEAADKVRGVKTTFRSAAELAPPSVVLALPVKSGATVKQPQLKIEAKVTKVGSQPVLKMQLLLDGRPYHGDKSLRVYKAGQPVGWDVDLPPGSHRLTVLAHTAVSSSRSDDMEITYTPASPPDPKSLLPTLYLVSVGINAYPGDWKLSCAVNDATKLVDTFHKKGKPPFRDIQHRLLTDKQATRAGILSELTWLKKQMKPQDIAVIFYAGHGTRDDKGRFYLLPVDFDLKALDSTAVSGDELKKRFADLPGRVLVMLDACHSGAIGARNKGGVTDELTRELTDDDCGVVMLCAAMGREEAGEERKLGHGYFALALIKGLSGEAGVSKRDGFVYLHHLHNYVIECVQELSNDEQHPVLGMPTTVRSFALAKPK